jgi:transposase
MRIIGIDLSVKGEHKSAMVDERGHFVSSIIPFRTDPASLKRLLELVQEGNPDRQIQAVMEPTGMAWFPVAVFLIRQGVVVYLVNSQQVADLRKYYKKHAHHRRREAASVGTVRPESHGLPARLQAAGSADDAAHRLQKPLDRPGSFCLAGTRRSCFRRSIQPGCSLVPPALV